MKKIKLDLYLTAGIIAIIAILSASFYFLGKSEYLKSLNPSPTLQVPTSPPTPIPTQDETADWITFRGDGYSYKFPPRWIAIEDQLLSYNPEEVPPAEVGLPVAKDRLKVDFVYLPPDYQLEPETEISDKKNILVGGKNATSQVECGQLGCARAIYIPLENEMLGLFVYPAESNLMSTFEKILTMLKFTSQDSADGEFCGGIAGIFCPTGYTCQYEGDFPDAGGVCVKE